jgi:hypothetical protein
LYVCTCGLRMAGIRIVAPPTWPGGSRGHSGCYPVWQVPACFRAQLCSSCLHQAQGGQAKCKEIAASRGCRRVFMSLVWLCECRPWVAAAGGAAALFWQWAPPPPNLLGHTTLNLPPCIGRRGVAPGICCSAWAALCGNTHPRRCSAISKGA